MEWYLKVLRQYADFNGRARRKEYWMFTLFTLIIAIVLAIIDNALGLVVSGFGMLGLIYTLAVLLPSIGVSIRRLHDINRTGWWLPLGLVPIIGFIVLIVFAVMAGDQGHNRYGSDPKSTAGDPATAY